MPTVGPHGRPAYYPDEAYNRMGSHLFVHEWERRFSGKGPIPDLALTREQSDNGAKFPAEIEDFLKADRERADRMQTQRRREDEVLTRIVKALLYGKAECWLRDGDNWRPVLGHEWQEGTETRQELLAFLREEIAAVLRDGKPAPGRLLIDKERCDIWVHGEDRPREQSPLVSPNRRPAHRPSPDYQRMQAILACRVEQGLVDLSRSRLHEAEELRARYYDEYPTAARVSAETIVRHLKPDFDKYGLVKRGA